MGRYPAGNTPESEGNQDHHQQRRLPCSDDPVNLHLVEIEHREKESERDEEVAKPRPNGALGRLRLINGLRLLRQAVLRLVR
jgi:hypothetical protein